MRVHLLTLMSLMCLFPVGLARGAADLETDSDVSVRTAQEILRTRSNMPWYDPEHDALRPISVSPDADDQHRQSRWAADQAADPQLSRDAASTAPSLFWRLMQILAWFALAVLLIAVLGLMVWAVSRIDRSGLAEEKSLDQQIVDPARMEELPMAIPPTDQNLLLAARACYEAGDYSLAIIYAYAYQLVQLDQHRAIQLRKGKTNRQYLRELSRYPRLRELLLLTMLAFEDVFFGHHTLSQTRFQQCWDSLDEFQRQLEPLA